MEECKFKLGDKVRLKTNHNLIGIVRAIEVNNWCGTISTFVTISATKHYTIDVDARDIEKIDEEKETKEMTTYNVGDSVYHPLYNESIIIDISSFSESGHIKIVPLTGLHRGIPILVSIDTIKLIDNKLIISVDDYNKMANTIENLKKENIKLKDDALTLVDEKWNLKNENKHLRKEKTEMQERLYNTLFGYNGYKLPEVKEVLYHKPATIIFWKDGTKTVVKAQKKEKYDNEKGFVMAYLKKILGNEGNYYEVIKRWTDTQ